MAAAGRSSSSFRALPTAASAARTAATSPSGLRLLRLWYDPEVLTVKCLRSQTELPLENARVPGEQKCRGSTEGYKFSNVG
jgi:hypothetical protein